MIMIILMRFYPIMIMEAADLLFWYLVNQMRQLLSGQTTPNSWVVPFQINSFFGQGITKGLPTEQNWNHFALYYNGWFDNPLFIAHGFNQLQCASCIQSSARITGKNAATLKSLGELANSEAFRRQLIWARDHPHSKEAKSLNAKFVGSSQWWD